MHCITNTVTAAHKTYIIKYLQSYLQNLSPGVSCHITHISTSKLTENNTSKFAAWYSPIFKHKLLSSSAQLLFMLLMSFTEQQDLQSSFWVVTPCQVTNN